MAKKRKVNFLKIATEPKGPAKKPSKFLIDLAPRPDEKKVSLFSKLIKRPAAIKTASKAEYVSLNAEGVKPTEENDLAKPLTEKKKYELNLSAGRLIQKINNSRLNQLAFFSLIFFAIKLFITLIRLGFYISYATGWLLAFLVKFVFNFSAAVLYPPVKYTALGLEKFGLAMLIVLKTSLSFFSSSIRLPLKLAGGVKAIIDRPKPETILSEETQDQGYIDKSFLEMPARASIEKRYFFFFTPNPSLRSLSAAFSFLVLIFLLVLPVKAYTFYKSLNIAETKGKVLGVSMDAFGNILSAGKALSGFQFNAASDSFSQASDNFLSAEGEVREINNLLFVLAGLLPDEKYKLASEGKNIIEAGRLGSDLGKNLTDAVNVLFSITGGEAQEKNVIDILNEFRPKIIEALNISSELNAVVAKINLNNIPEEQRDNFKKIAKMGKETETMLNDLASLTGTMESLLGGKEKKRYLLIFQNNAEMRGSGGFLGSFAILDMNKGKITSLDVPGGGGYDTKGALTKMVEAPMAMHLLGARWFFWDANWWPDWPKTAQKLMWFYENSDGSTVDGVIALTPTVMEKLLAVTGPVDLSEEYGVTVNAENFWLTTQSITESNEQRASGTPKKIIGDLMKKIMDELPKNITKENFTGLAKVIESSLNEKQALVYMTDPNLEKEIERYGWDGKLNETVGDYLMVVNTNIGGQKTDKAIKQSIRHEADIDEDGRITNTLRITRTHQGIKNEIFTGVRNVDWMRIYVPQGAELMEAYGFIPVDPSLYKPAFSQLEEDPDILAGEGQAEIHNLSGTKIYNELGKTVFANWVMVDPGESAEIVLRYRLPFKAFSQPENREDWKENISEFLNPGQSELSPYSLMVEKQPGSIESDFRSDLKLDGSFKIVWHYPEAANINENGWKIEDRLVIDKYWGVVISN